MVSPVDGMRVLLGLRRGSVRAVGRVVESPVRERHILQDVKPSSLAPVELPGVPAVSPPPVVVPPFNEVPKVTLEDKVNGLKPALDVSGETQSVFREPKPDEVNIKLTLANIVSKVRLGRTERKFLSKLALLTDCKPFNTGVYVDLGRIFGGDYCRSLMRSLKKFDIVRQTKEKYTGYTVNDYSWNPAFLVYSGCEKMYPDLTPEEEPAGGVSKQTRLLSYANMDLAVLDAKISAVLALQRKDLGLDDSTRRTLAQLEGQLVGIEESIGDIDSEGDYLSSQLADECRSALEERRMADYVDLSAKLLEREVKVRRYSTKRNELQNIIKDILYKLVGLEYGSKKTEDAAVDVDDENGNGKD